MNKIIPFGSLVRDKVTGFQGFVTFRAEHMNNCIRYGVQPGLDKEGQLPEEQVLDGPNLEIIAPLKDGLPPAVKTPNTFKLGVKVKDRLTEFTGVAVVRVKYMHSGDRYGVQAPVNAKGEIPKIVSFDEEDLEQVDPPPPPRKKKKEKKPKPPAGPHDHSIAIAR